MVLTNVCWESQGGTHISRNSGEEPSGYLVTAEFPARCSLCQQKCLGVTPWDILTPVLLMGMGWHSLYPSQPLHFWDSMKWGILSDAKPSGCFLRNVPFWQRDIQIAPLHQQERLLASPAALHAGNQEEKCSQKGSYRDLLVTFHCHWSVSLLLLPASFHTVTRCSLLSLELLVTHLFHVPHCCRTWHVGNDSPQHAHTSA